MKNKICIGMHRPLWEDLLLTIGSVQGVSIISCSCGSSLESFQSLREHWQMGHFDTPVYAKWGTTILLVNKEDINQKPSDETKTPSQ